MVLGLGQAHVHGVDAEVGRTEVAPAVGEGSPVLLGYGAEREPGLDSDRCRVASSLLRRGTDVVDPRPCFVVRWGLGGPPVTEPSGPV